MSTPPPTTTLPSSQITPAQMRAIDERQNANQARVTTTDRSRISAVFSRATSTANGTNTTSNYRPTGQQNPPGQATLSATPLIQSLPATPPPTLVPPQAPRPEMVPLPSIEEVFHTLRINLNRERAEQIIQDYLHGHHHHSHRR